MSIIAKLHVEDQQFNILNYQVSFNQTCGVLGVPTAMPLGGLFEITLESSRNNLFFEWTTQPTKLRQATIVQTSVRMDGRSRTFELIDVFCIQNKLHFNAVNSRPMTECILLSPAILKLDGVLLFEKHWKETDIITQNLPPTIFYNKAELISYYITDSNDNVLDEYVTGSSIKLNIETKNAIGKNIVISLHDKTHDFKYNGQILENDTLKDYLITADLEKIELDVMEQQH